MNVLTEVFTTVGWNQRKYGHKGNIVQMAGDKTYGYAEKLNDTKRTKQMVVMKCMPVTRTL